MNDMALGENKMSSVCWAKNAMCAWTDSLASARISKQCWVCSSALVGGVLPLRIQRRGSLGTRGEPEVCAHSTVPRLCPLSGVGGSRGDLDARPKGGCDGDKRRWVVVLGCVVLCCVGLCCVVLCCVGLGCVVLVGLGCVVVCCVGCVVLLCCDVLLGWVWWCCVLSRCCGDVMCAVEQESGEMARREPQDLSVTVELGLCHCSRLPGKVDNQTD